MKYVWTNTDLVAGWCVTPYRNQINIDLWQVYIDGKKPVELSGARDNAIIKTSPTTSGVAAKVSAPEKPNTRGGLLISPTTTSQPTNQIESQTN